MEIIQKTQVINVEALAHALIAQRSTRKTFRLPCTTSQAYDMLLGAYEAEVLHRNRKFSADEPTKEHIIKLAKFLTSPQGKFGFMLVGNCGNGKTTLLSAMQNLLIYLEKRGVIDSSCLLTVKDAREIIVSAKKDYKIMDGLKDQQMLAIEDIGRESTEVIDYGNIYNPILDLLEYRYARQLFTAFTTNLSVDELKEKYGARLSDRFREMFAKIVFTNKSYR